jgi:hypothetical protein
MEHTRFLELVPDDELLRRLEALLQQSRRIEADLVALIGEVDTRRLYARDASPSMFAWCTEILHLSEAEAYLRIAAARASREHPMLLTMLADGRLHLTGVAKLAPHLTLENRDELLKRATHRTKRRIEELVAELSPGLDAPGVMRKLPERRAVMTAPAGLGPHAEAPVLGRNPEEGTVAGRRLRPDGAGACIPELRPDGVAPARSGLLPEPVAKLPSESRPEGIAVPPPRSSLQPLALARYKVQFTASAELRDKLERLRSMMRPSVPDGDLAAIIDAAVTEKLERLEARRFARTKASGRGPAASQEPPSSRHIPATVRRAVYERDGGRCRYVDVQGRRCAARDGLEFHHRHPFGLGGDHSVDNVSLLCRAHNGLLADVDYGRVAMASHRRSRASTPDLGPQPA